MTVILSLLFVFTRCEEDDSKKIWGIPLIYMPQASFVDGGATHNYPVPLAGNIPTQNYVIDSVANIINIVLGVRISGMQIPDSFSVKIAVDLAATSAAAFSISKGIELPSDVYTLPSQITVNENQREGVFYLQVDLNKLIAEYPSYAKNKMVLVVGISNPTKYELNENLAKTTVIIDGSAFMPIPKIVEGGDFGTGSEQYWNFVSMYGNLPASYAAIVDGVLRFDYGTTPVYGEICCYQLIELTNGSQYKFSCDFNSTGGSNITSCRFYLAVSPVKPVVTGTSYPYDKGMTFYSILDAWNGLKNPVNGTLPQKGGWQQGIDKATGLFTANFSGTGYLVIGAAAWNSSIGTIVIDNVKIEEQ
jgi:hypothetical protein